MNSVLRSLEAEPEEVASQHSTTLQAAVIASLRLGFRRLLQNPSAKALYSYVHERDNNEEFQWPLD